MGNTKKRRCVWAETDELLKAYHDVEWGVPQRDSRALWEMLMLEGFQAGLAWIIVLRKRDALRKAFAGFDPAKVARFKEKEIQNLLGNEGIIRSRAKIEATIQGAKIFLAMGKRGENFSEFCWSFTNGKALQRDRARSRASSPLSEEISRQMKLRGFKFVGPVIVYAWMQAVGMVNDHASHCFRRKQVAA
jgi:DNA-3-methyladenine glycosylase I